MNATCAVFAYKRKMKESVHTSEPDIFTTTITRSVRALFSEVWVVTVTVSSPNKIVKGCANLWRQNVRPGLTSAEHATKRFHPKCITTTLLAESARLSHTKAVEAVKTDLQQRRNAWRRAMVETSIYRPQPQSLKSVSISQSPDRVTRPPSVTTMTSPFGDVFRSPTQVAAGIKTISRPRQHVTQHVGSTISTTRLRLQPPLPPQQPPAPDRKPATMTSTKVVVALVWRGSTSIGLRALVRSSTGLGVVETWTDLSPEKIVYLPV